ncbi:hypothetical protein J3D47_000192 [Pseudomonas laurylsulfativorans]|uniref:hypothetical protein n=1 Tax=Pseudomonas laurylsulfativorans TaxID=1943631 RepID=UPI0020A20AA8|nr:hypothetical protein [Pseudomonas laurylsulfativorans]MCP1415949.1 hypothetical protein [Pseudomonas laurylsulfativorans]
MNELSDDEFHDALSCEDHLGMVIRGHIHIEHWVDRFLLSAMPCYDKYAEDINADYETKTLLCCALGLTPELKGPLALIGKLRNRFAHRPSYKLTKSDVDNLYAALSGTHQQHLKKSYKALALRYQREEASFSKLGNIERLNLLFMLLRAKLKKAHAQLNENA